MEKTIIHITAIGDKELKKAQYDNLYIDITLDELRKIFRNYGYRTPKLKDLEEAMDFFDDLYNWAEHNCYDSYWYYHLLDVECENLLGKIEIDDNYEYFELPYSKENLWVIGG